MAKILGVHFIAPTGTGYVSYVPVITGFGTVSNVQLQWKRTGDTLSIRGRFTAGTVAALLASIPLPNSRVVASTANGTEVKGRWYRENSSASTRKAGNLIFSGGATSINFGSDDYTSTISPVSGGGINGNIVCGNGDTIFIEIEGIPIQTWTVNN